jgi:hypothetical protein
MPFPYTEVIAFTALLALLSTQDAKTLLTLGAFVLAQAGLYYLLRFALLPSAAGGDERALRKQRSWLLSLHVSVIFGGLIAPVYFCWTVGAIWRGAPAFNAFWAAETEGVRLLSLYFVAFCLCDLLVGLREYREHLQWDSGFLHHTTFVWLLLHVFLPHGLGVFFLVYSPFEVPTLILALGSVFPGLRSDALFGATFFAFRIVYHVFMFAYCALASSAPAWAVWASGSPTLVFHLMWFYRWAIGQLRRSSAKGAPLGKGRESVVDQPRAPPRARD